MAPELGELQLLLLCRSRRVSRGAGCCFSLNGDSVLARDFVVGYPALYLWEALRTPICSGSLPHSLPQHPSKLNPLLSFPRALGTRGACMSVDVAHSCQCM